MCHVLVCSVLHGGAWVVTTDPEHDGVCSAETDLELWAADNRVIAMKISVNVRMMSNNTSGQKI